MHNTYVSLYIVYFISLLYQGSQEIVILDVVRTGSTDGNVTVTYNITCCSKLISIVYIRNTIIYYAMCRSFITILACVHLFMYKVHRDLPTIILSIIDSYADRSIKHNASIIEVFSYKN